MTILISFPIGNETITLAYDVVARTATVKSATLEEEESPEGTPGEAVDWLLSRLIGREE